MRGYLRLPNKEGQWPCLLITSGADSTKDEFRSLEDEFLARGMATFSFDGPGQGLVRRDLSSRPDFEKPVSAVVDVLQELPGIDRNRLGIWGRSLGGYYACRAAAFDKRLKACINAAGFYYLSDNFSDLDQKSSAPMLYMLGEKDIEKARLAAKAFHLEGVMQQVACPLLIVQSEYDGVLKLAGAQRMQREAGGPVELVVYPDGDHVCDNIPYKVRPMMADWMRRHLAANASTRRSL